MQVLLIYDITKIIKFPEVAERFMQQSVKLYHAGSTPALRTMTFFRKHRRFWEIVTVIASLSLVATSFLPLLGLR